MKLRFCFSLAILAFALHTFCSDVAIHDLLSEAVSEKLKVNHDQVRVEIKPSDVFKVKADDISNIAITFLNTREKTFDSRLTTHNNMNYEISGRYELYTKALIASQVIKQGDIISEHNTHLVDIASEPGRHHSNIDEIYGMQIKKNIYKGSVIKFSDLVHPVIVKERDIVDVVYISGNVYLKTKGIALQKGAFGDYIKIKNEKSGAVLSAKIIDNKTVEISSDHEK